MHVKDLSSRYFIHIIFIVSLTTFDPPLKQWYHNILQILTLLNELFMDYLFVGISPPYFATTLRYEEKKTTKER